MTLGRQLLVTQPETEDGCIQRRPSNSHKVIDSYIFSEQYILEEWHNLLGEDLSCAETLRVQHDLGNELSVRLGHGQAAEQFLQIVWQVGAASVARIHGDEDGHVWADLHLLVQELCGDWHT